MHKLILLILVCLCSVAYAEPRRGDHRTDNHRSPSWDHRGGHPQYQHRYNYFPSYRGYRPFGDRYCYPIPEPIPVRPYAAPVIIYPAPVYNVYPFSYTYPYNNGINIQFGFSW